MSNINLLPWREELRQVKNKRFLAIVMAAMLASGCLVFCFDLYIAYKMAAFQVDADYLERSLSAVDSRLKEIQNLKQDKKDLLSRMKVIRALEIDRVSLVRLLDMIPRVLSDSIYITEIDRSENNQDKNNQNSNEKNTNDFINTIKKNQSTQDVFEKKQYLVLVKGVSVNNNAISILLKSLSDISWISGVQLNQVQELKKDNAQGSTGFEFTLQFLQNLYEA